MKNISNSSPGKPAGTVFPAASAAIAIFTIFAAVSHAQERSPDLGIATRQTPYDRFFGPMQNVMRQLGPTHPPLTEVSDLVRQGRAFRYSCTGRHVPQTPEVTERLQAGDCKAKSLWLASRMNDASVRFVVGKARRGGKGSHAWLLWRNQGRWFILDPTLRSAAVERAKISEDDWVPLFSYSAHGKFRHEAARRIADWDLPDPIDPSFSPPQPGAFAQLRAHSQLIAFPLTRGRP